MDTLTSIDKESIERLGLEKVSSGKVRELYKLDETSLLFVATDRISAFDVILKNGIPGKGELLTQLSLHWFDLIRRRLPDVKTHVVRDTNLWSKLPDLQKRSMVVRKLRVLPIESIVRGYITGSAWAEYTEKGTVHGMSMPAGLNECQQFDQAIWTASTKAQVGDKDENITSQAVSELIGHKYAKQVERLSLQVYNLASKYAAERGIIIADTKFEFGVDETDQVVLIDEVLTPDSSRFWPAATYAVGRAQDSFDKQPLRDWLTRHGLKGKQGVEMPQDVVDETARRYSKAFDLLTSTP